MSNISINAFCTGQENKVIFSPLNVLLTACVITYASRNNFGENEVFQAKRVGNFKPLFSSVCVDENVSNCIIQFFR